MPSAFHVKMRRVARFHFWLLFFSFVTYLGLGFSLGPGFFKTDLIERLQTLADDVIVVTATVLGPPAKPVVTATPVCVSGVPRIILDWADDQATDTWDIERDLNPLVTGLVTSTYTDTAVIANATYSYVVTANGPMSPGMAVSDPVSATALDCPNILPPATVLIQTLGDTNVSVNRNDVVLSRRRPMVTGTTNIPNATISILMTNPTMQAMTTANGNGYFSWIPPLRLDTGTHILSVTATDPNDSSRTATDSFVFRTKNDDADDGGDGGGTTTTQPIPPVPGVPALSLDFSVQVENMDSILYQGTDLMLTIRSLSGDLPVGSTWSVYLSDERGKDVLRFPSQRIDDRGKTDLKFSREIPLALTPGNYRVRVDAEYARALVSREARLIVQALPLFDLGGGYEITYPEIARFVGTVFYVLLLLFFLYLLLFFREYLLSLQALRHITEYHLARLGFIPKRGKGVRL